MAYILVHEEKKNFYKRFLYEPFPVESALSEQLVEHLNAEIAAGTLQSKAHCFDYLTWTYFFRRLTKNPAFYDLHQTDANSINQYLKNLIERCLGALTTSKCIAVHPDDDTIESTQLGYIASFYYISHETVRLFGS